MITIGTRLDCYGAGVFDAVRCKTTHRVIPAIIETKASISLFCTDLRTPDQRHALDDLVIGQCDDSTLDELKVIHIVSYKKDWKVKK